MAFSGLDVSVEESIFLLCIIVFGGIICSVIFLQCCRYTAGGRAERLYEEEHQRALEEQQRTIRASIDESKEPRHKNDESISVSPVYVQLQSPDKLYNSWYSDNQSGSGKTPGKQASAPPKPKPQIKIELPKRPEVNVSPWNSLSDCSVSLQAAHSGLVHQPQLHAAQSKSFMDEKNSQEYAVRHGKSFQFANSNSDTGVTLKRVSSKKYNSGRMVDLETPRLKLVDILNSDENEFEFGYERKTTEL